MGGRFGIAIWMQMFLSLGCELLRVSLQEMFVKYPLRANTSDMMWEIVKDI